MTRAALNMVMFRSDSMVMFRPGPRFAAHRRNGTAYEQGKKFLARTCARDASLMHENNLIDQ